MDDFSTKVSPKTKQWEKFRSENNSFFRIPKIELSKKDVLKRIEKEHHLIDDSLFLKFFRIFIL